MVANSKVTEKVAQIYRWLDSQTAHYADLCKACGKCCDFASFDHRLYVTTPELIYFAEKLKPQNIKPVSDGRCPYNVDSKCSVYENRFAACRIFCCTTDKDLQSELSEQALKKLKSLCENFQVPYRYMDLISALKKLQNHI